MASAVESIKAEFISQDELAGLFNVTPARIRDLRSIAKKKGKVFIKAYQPSATCVLFHVDDVKDFILNSEIEINSGKKDDV